jgi:hypothetical protein
VTVRAARTGDICILLDPSLPPPTTVNALLKRLQAAFGGRIVEPLHVTVDRVEPVDAEVLVAAIRGCIPRLTRAAVRGSALFELRSDYRGADVLKLIVARDDALDHNVDQLRAGLREAGLRPMYGDERSLSVTALERIERSAAVDAASWGLPMDLFVGDTLLVSRILGVGSYEILDRVGIPAAR